MAEAIRLVIWDLDETFWKGTVTEGGIREYVSENHEIVIELARRGILSSVCSKNDPATVLPILAEKGILEYFVFPSISWEAKGPRLVELIDSMQLRASTVIFIDDHAANLAEAEALSPGIQVADPTFIAHMLADDRFVGKDDHALSRLGQYKLLEQRKRDERQSPVDNADFLRGCDIRVYIEYDVESHIDRAIELINRTNQLNYTKHRLPEDIDQARQALRAEMNVYIRQAGLIRVVDKYGDYGFVGFFMTESLRTSLSEGDANSHLRHFCFSCRTLGMSVETWVYDHLGRPELTVVGAVLTDLAERRPMDWIRQVQSLDYTGQTLPQIAPQVLLWGGCEVNAIGVYLKAYTDRLETFGNYVAGGCFVRVDSVVHVMSICDSDPRVVAPDVEAMSLPAAMVANDIFATAVPGTVFVMNFGLDAAGASHARHRSNGMTLFIEPRQFPGVNLATLTEEYLAGYVEKTRAEYTEDQQEQLLRAGSHVRQCFEYVPPLEEAQRIGLIRELIGRIPGGCKLVIVVDHDEARDETGSLITVPWRTHWKRLMTDLAGEFRFVGVASFSEVIRSTTEVEGPGNHYQREIYLRFAHRLVEVIGRLEARPSKLSAGEALLPAAL